jgi:hypothetical protein
MPVQYVVALVLLLAALVVLRELAQMLSGVSSGLGGAFSSPGHVLALVAISLVIVAVILLVFYETTVYVKRQRLRRPASWTVPVSPASSPAGTAAGTAAETPVEAEERLLSGEAGLSEPSVPPTTPPTLEEAVAAGEVVIDPPPLFAPRITEVPAPDPLPKRTPSADGARTNGAVSNGVGSNGIGSRVMRPDEPAPEADDEKSSDWLANARLLIAPDPVQDEPFPRTLEDGDRRRVSLCSFTVRIPKIDLEARLISSEVRQAARSLASDPASDSLRLALVTALTSDSDGLFLNEPPVVLRVTTVRASGGPVRDRLDELVLITADGKPGHRVRAIDPSPEARLLLTGNPRLASALVNAAFPVEGADTAVLDQRLLGTIEALDLDGSIRRKPTAPSDGTPLEIDSLSGASTGASRSIAS